MLGAAQETIPREQLAALLMAIVWRGMSTAETVSLTSAMLASGSTLSFPKHTGIVVDKHSTGGVGDKVQAQRESVCVWGGGCVCGWVRVRCCGWC